MIPSEFLVLSRGQSADLGVACQFGYVLRMSAVKSLDKRLMAGYRRVRLPIFSGLDGRRLARSGENRCGLVSRTAGQSLQ